MSLLLRTASAAFALATLAFAVAPASATEIGAYRGPGCDGRKAMASFEKLIGRKVDRTVDSLNWWTNWRETRRSIPWVTKCWSGSGIKLTLSVPMLPSKEPGATLARGAEGAYDHIFLETAHHLVKNGLEDTVVRIGWEFNGDWMPWAAHKDPENYKRYFRRIVETMRSVPGQRFKFEWCPNVGRHAIDPPDAYPGDDVVDIIGMDIYSETWDASTRDPEKRWQSFLDRPFGLKWHRDFARAHGKEMSYPEWGAGDRTGGGGVGDDPVFIAGMADWFEEVKPLYQSYWDVEARDYQSQLSNGRFPKAEAVFRQRFGTPEVQAE